jgi:CO/xanthine dehydrogenase FAD-binding subunit
MLDLLDRLLDEALPITTMMDSGFDLLHEAYVLMKAPDFRYIRPQSLAQAYRILAVNAGAAVSLASGQNLPAGPRVSGEICLRALVRHCEMLQSGLVRSRLLLLTEAGKHVGHWAVRKCGTLGGSPGGSPSTMRLSPSAQRFCITHSHRNASSTRLRHHDVEVVDAPICSGA